MPPHHHCTIMQAAAYLLVKTLASSCSGFCDHLSNNGDKGHCASKGTTAVNVSDFNATELLKFVCREV
jgi:hypothetical protein